MKAWKRIEPTSKVSGEHRSLTVKTFELPDGRKLSFDTYDSEGIHHAGAVAITRDGKAIVVRQFRPGPEEIMDEIPGGTLEPGEDANVAVARELEEETGYRPGKIEFLGKIRKDAYMNATWHYFLATDCELTGNGQHLDSREDIELQLISIDELIENARGGHMTDIDAVFLAYEKLKELKVGK